jgi:hypothetical protein
VILLSPLYASPINIGFPVLVLEKLNHPSMVALLVLNDAFSEAGTVTYFVTLEFPKFRALPPGLVERYRGDPHPDCVMVGDGTELMFAVTAILGFEVHPLSVKST